MGEGEEEGDTQRCPIAIKRVPIDWCALYQLDAIKGALIGWLGKEL